MTVPARGAYPAAWPELSRAVKAAAGWRCVRCGWPHEPATWHGLTVAHLNHDRSDTAWFVLAALCARCHLWSHARIVLQQPRLIGAHEPWLLPYLAGWHARRVLGVELPRVEVVARLAELLSLEYAPAGAPAPMREDDAPGADVGRSAGDVRAGRLAGPTGRQAAAAAAARRAL